MITLRFIVGLCCLLPMLETLASVPIPVGFWGGSVFTIPNRGAALVAWYKADVGVYENAGTDTAEDGDGVQQWNDQSGNSKHVSQATAGDRPLFKANILNGLPAVQFVSSDWLGLGSALLNDFPLTFYIVARSSDTSTYQVVAGIANTGSAWDFQAVFFAGASAQKIWIDTGAGGGDTPAATSASYVADTPYIITAQVTSATSRAIWLNSGSSGSNDTNLDPTGINEFSIGVLRKSPQSHPFTGYVMEIVVINEADDASERLAMEQYLAARWGITL